MKKYIPIIMLTALLAGTLSGCGPYGRDTLGIVGGGLAGAAIGSAVSRGSGVGTAIGAVGGAVAGQAVARHIRY